MSKKEYRDGFIGGGRSRAESDMDSGDGCAHHEECLTCPFPYCVLDLTPGQKNRMLSKYGHLGKPFTRLTHQSR